MRYAVVVAAVLLVWCGTLAWAFRYEYLPPVAARTVAGENETVIVCAVDRWTRDTACDRIAVDAKAAVAEMEVWLRKRNSKAVGEYVPYYSPLNPNNAKK